MAIPTFDAARLRLDADPMAQYCLELTARWIR
jgi:hypothetical protein